MWYCERCKKNVEVHVFFGEYGSYTSRTSLKKIVADVCVMLEEDTNKMIQGDNVECHECGWLAKWRD